jgi:hypothetical protein
MEAGPFSRNEGSNALIALLNPSVCSGILLGG